MKRLSAAILIGLAVLASAWAVRGLVRTKPGVVQTTRSQDVGEPARRVPASDQQGATSEAPVAAIPKPVDLAPPTVAPDVVDGSLFGPTLLEGPPANVADQRRMLQDMLTTFDAADPLLLDVADAARDRARLALLLKRIAAGQSIPADLFESMVRQFDRREQVVMERLARQYQLHVSRVFRRDTQQRLDRLAAWDDVLKSWRRAGSPRAQRHELNVWLLAGIANSTPDSIKPLPTAPRFSFGADLSSNAVARPAAASRDQTPTAPAATPVRMSTGPQLAGLASSTQRRRALGVATLLDRRARSAVYGDVSREAPRVARVSWDRDQTWDQAPLSPDQPSVDQRQVVSRPDPTAARALPDRQAGLRLASDYAPRTTAERRMGRGRFATRRRANSSATRLFAAVDRLPAPVRHARPLMADDWSEPPVEPPVASSSVAPELLAENMVPSREPHAPAAQVIHFAQFTARLAGDSASSIARRPRRANSRDGWGGLSSVETGRAPLLSGHRVAGVGLPAAERLAIPKVAWSEGSQPAVAGAVVPSRQQHELDVDTVSRPLTHAPPTGPAPVVARPVMPTRRTSLRSAAFARPADAHDHRIVRAVTRGNTAGRPNLALLAGRSNRSTSGARVVLNLDEVSARIAGFNLALRAMASQLDQNQVWTSTRLTPVVERLRELYVRHDDLTLYLQLLDELDRDLVGRLESPRSIVTRLSTRIYEARRRVQGSRGTSADREREVELSALDALSRRLVALTM